MPFKESTEFTSAEVEAHALHLSAIIDAARGHLEQVWSDHVAFHKRHHVSRYYGDRNKSLDAQDERVAALKAAGAPASLVDQLVPISCVGLARDALRKGLNTPGDPALKSILTKIEAYAKANDLDGSAVIDALQKLGWKILYWNPDPAQNDKWDSEDGNRSSRGYHAYTYMTTKKKGTYYYNRVDEKELLVGFGTKIPEEFLRIPFFIGVAHQGYHVFPGFYGRVIEAHSMRALASIDNIENAPFNPLANGGAPRWTSSEKYRSGLICVPPGSF